MVQVIRKQIRNNYTEGHFAKKYIVIHETDNEDVAANALAHFNYWDTNPNAQASANVVVDDKVVVEMMDWDDRSWAVGVIFGNPRNITDADNYNTINVEICVNKDGDYMKARQNAIEYVRDVLMPKTGIPESHVIRHFDCCLKWCPRRMLNTPGLWDDFKAQLRGATPAPAPSVAPAPVNPLVFDQSTVDLQKSLNRLGFKGENGLALKEDGLKGTNTTFATRSFQTVMGLDPDGTAGSLTWGALNEILAKPLDSVPAPHYEYATRYISYRVGGGAVTGTFNSALAARVTAWQRSKGLNPDGVIGTNSWRVLIG